MSLDVMLTLCYQSMMKNPEGAFATASGKTVDAGEAVKKLDRMSQSLGELIDKENNLITKVIKSDKAR